MHYLFYLLVIPALLYELCNLVSPGRVIAMKRAVKGKKFDDYKNSHKTVGVLSLFYFIWAVVGLFTSQWLLFLVLVIISAIPKGYYKIAIIIDALFSASLLLLIVINRYHLGFDMKQLIQIVLP